MELLPGEELPELVGTACCSQFAVSRERIHERGIEVYQRARQFLIETTLGSEISGRVFEYIWHSMSPPFLRNAVLSFKRFKGALGASADLICVQLYLGNQRSIARMLESATAERMDIATRPTRNCRDSGCGAA
jgi:hypothetical protein